jgi:hypothetical protein
MRTWRRSLAELHRELVPLGEAAAVTYSIVADRRDSLGAQEALDEVRALIAIALSGVAPVLRQENGDAVPLSAPEIQERLFRARGRRADLAGLCMRRSDLLKAVETLKDAQLMRGKEDLLAGLRNRF